VKRRLLLLAPTLALVGVFTPPASAADHLMQVSEVYPAPTLSQQFVELRDPVSEPFPFGPYILALHDGNGALIAQQMVNANGFRNSTAPWLIARSTPRDEALTVDPLPASGAQLCFYRSGTVSPGTRINCLGYGNINTPLGGTGPAPSAGQSVQRLDCGNIGVAGPTRDADNAACSSGGGGGGGGGGGAGGGSDATDPTVRLRARRRQDVDRLAIVVRSNERSTVTVRASVSVPGAARTLRFRTVKRSLAPNRRRRIRLRLSRSRKRAVKRALRRGRRLRARIRITVRDRAGNSTVRRLRIRLTD
jgi:hypothetical protein